MFTANIIFILSMRIIIEICNTFSEITFLLFEYIYHFTGFNAGILLVVLRFKNFFIRWTRYRIILKFHMVRMLMKFRCNVRKVGRRV